MVTIVSTSQETWRLSKRLAPFKEFIAWYETAWFRMLQHVALTEVPKSKKKKKLSP
jgi:hypothetical protein